MENLKKIIKQFPKVGEVKEIKGLKPGKKYYVKVRTYKEVKSGTKKVRIYSDWSKKKAVQIKK